MEKPPSTRMRTRVSPPLWAGFSAFRRTSRKSSTRTRVYSRHRLDALQVGIEKPQKPAMTSNPLNHRGIILIKPAGYEKAVRLLAEVEKEYLIGKSMDFAIFGAFCWSASNYRNTHIVSMVAFAMTAVVWSQIVKGSIISSLRCRAYLRTLPRDSMREDLEDMRRPTRRIAESIQKRLGDPNFI